MERTHDVELAQLRALDIQYVVQYTDVEERVLAILPTHEIEVLVGHCDRMERKAFLSDLLGLDEGEELPDLTGLPALPV